MVMERLVVMKTSWNGALVVEIGGEIRVEVAHRPDPTRPSTAHGVAEWASGTHGDGGGDGDIEARRSGAHGDGVEARAELAPHHEPAQARSHTAKDAVLRAVSEQHRCVFTDGSLSNSDRRTRRAGWWVTLLTTSQFHEASVADLAQGWFGDVDGRQTAAAAELAALWWALRLTQGPITVVTDCEMVVKGWRKGKHLRPTGIECRLVGQDSRGLCPAERRRQKSKVLLAFGSQHRT